MFLLLRSWKLYNPIGHLIASQKINFTAFQSFFCKYLFQRNIDHYYFDFLFLNFPASILFLIRSCFVTNFSLAVSVKSVLLKKSVAKILVTFQQNTHVEFFLSTLADLPGSFPKYSIEQLFEIRACGVCLCKKNSRVNFISGVFNNFINMTGSRL